MDIISPSTVVLEETPPSAKEPFWGYADVAIVIGLSFAFVVLLMAVVGVFAATIPAVKKNQDALLLPLQLVLYGMVYLAFYVTFRWRYGRPVLASLGWRKVKFNPALIAIAGIGLAFLVAAIASVLHTPKIPSPFEKLIGTPLALFLFAVFAVVVGPVMEELVFRGFIQPLLSRTFGVVAGIVGTALIFGALHGPEYSGAWQYMAAVSLAGIAFGWVRARTQSVIPSTLMHGAYNSVFVVALFVIKHGKHS